MEQLQVFILFMNTHFAEWLIYPQNNILYALEENRDLVGIVCLWLIRVKGLKGIFALRTYVA